MLEIWLWINSSKEGIQKKIANDNNLSLNWLEMKQKIARFPANLVHSGFFH